MHESDIIVIGAGVLGTFHAYFAARKGYKVTLIERNALPNDASVRNFGMIAPSIAEVGGAWESYARASVATYSALQQERDISVRHTGSLYLASTDIEATVLREFADAAPHGYRCIFLEAADARARFPFIQPDYCTAALLFPDDLTIDPRYMLRQVIPLITERENITYVPNTPIAAVSVVGRRVMVRGTRGESYAADRVFVCTGAEYRSLFPASYAASGLQVCKLQMMRTPPQPQALPHSILSGLSIQRYPAFKICPSYAAMVAQPSEPAIRDAGIHLLLKQAADGTITIGDSHEYRPVNDASAFEERTDCRINDTILRYGQSMVTLPTWEVQDLWNGYYLTHPTAQVYTETIDGAIHIVTGIGGKGMTTGPGFAQAHIEGVLG